MIKQYYDGYQSPWFDFVKSSKFYVNLIYKNLKQSITILLISVHHLPRPLFKVGGPWRLGDIYKFFKQSNKKSN